MPQEESDVCRCVRKEWSDIAAATIHILLTSSFVLLQGHAEILQSVVCGIKWVELLMQLMMGFLESVIHARG